MNTQPHLTTAELDTQLTQPGTPTDTEATILRSTLYDIRSSSLLAADFRLAAPRPDSKPAHAAQFPRWAMVAATAVLAVGAAIPLALNTTHPALPTPVAAKNAQQNAVENNITDDALLADIQTDLSTSVPASLQPLSTSTTISTGSDSSTSTK